MVVIGIPTSTLILLFYFICIKKMAVWAVFNIKKYAKIFKNFIYINAYLNYLFVIDWVYIKIGNKQNDTHTYIIYMLYIIHNIRISTSWW